VPLPRRPETFAGERAGAIFPPGSKFVKVTDRSRNGAGEYLTSARPTTVESARRRLALPPKHAVGEVREYRATSSVVATVGQIAGGSAGDVQVEVPKGAPLEEIGRWRLPFDCELRFGHVMAGMVTGVATGLIVGYVTGNVALGLVFGLLVGLLIGVLYPTDWTELFGITLGPWKTSLIFVS
jgi:hypothetical protein